MADRNAPMGASRLPWSRDNSEKIRFGSILALVLVVFLVPAALIPYLQLPEPERSEVERIPPRLAQLVEAPRPVELEKPDVQSEPEPEPEPEEVEQVPTVAETEPQSVPAPVETTSTEQTTEQARETAARSGLFAMRDRLAALQAPEPDARTESRAANIGSANANADVASNRPALAGSGGVQTGDGPVREVALTKHEVSTVDAPEEAAPAVAATAPGRSSIGERAMSNIRQVFDAQKSALYSLYQRELRQDPTLEGKVTLELVIEPDGSVSACQVVSSELGNPALEQRIAMRVQMFNFGAASVETRKVRFPIDFLPG